MTKILGLISLIFAINLQAGTISTLTASGDVLEFNTAINLSIKPIAGKKDSELKKDCAQQLTKGLKASLLNNRVNIKEEYIGSSGIEQTYLASVLYQEGESVYQLEAKMYSMFDIDSGSFTCGFEPMTQEIGRSINEDSAPFAVIRNRRFNGAIVSKTYLN